jgi:hypothetical protein
MDEKKLQALATELAKGIKTEADLNQFSRMLTKLTVETALNAELTDHLGHEKNTPKTGTNTRNGCSSKTLLIDDDEIALNTPRDREGTFEPQLIKKNQTRITQMDSQILSLYAKGMTTHEIVATFKEMYDADMAATLISKVTDAVKEQVTEWQNRPLDSHEIKTAVHLPSRRKSFAAVSPNSLHIAKLTDRIANRHQQLTGDKHGDARRCFAQLRTLSPIGGDLVECRYPRRGHGVGHDLLTICPNTFTL